MFCFSLSKLLFQAANFCTYVLTISLVSGAAYAELHPRDLDGDLYNGHEGVYDDVLDITWLADANIASTNTFGVTGVNVDGSMVWQTALDITLAMNAFNSGAGYLEVNTWRLHYTAPVDGSLPFDVSISYDGSTDEGYQISAPIDPTYNPNGQSSGFTGAELAYHYYNNFGALGTVWGAGGSVNGGLPGPDFGLDTATNNGNIALFSNLQGASYWTGQSPGPGSNKYFIFDLAGGAQSNVFGNSFAFYLWPVAPGDVGEPVALSENIPFLPTGAVIMLATLLILSRKIRLHRSA